MAAELFSKAARWEKIHSFRISPEVKRNENSARINNRRFLVTERANHYAPVGRSFKVRMEKIAGAKIKAWWFNPRNGKPTAIGTFDNKNGREFIPPDAGEMLDWVLVLDDAAKKFPPPGTRP